MDTNIKVIRSNRRKKTIQAKMVNDVFYVYVPAGLTQHQEDKWVQIMKERYEKKHRSNILNSDDALQQRAQEINKRFFQGKLVFDISYVPNQTAKFGCCDTRNRKIRISDRVATMPAWVQDYILIHELAHLMYPNHSKQFWEKVHTYRFAERAKGYLIAVGMSRHEETNDR
ncbi:MAG: M48 family metallopeptidase [Candidatus Thermoplasmatota archaeon]